MSNFCRRHSGPFCKKSCRWNLSRWVRSLSSPTIHNVMFTNFVSRFEGKQCISGREQTVRPTGSQAAQRFCIAEFHGSKTNLRALASSRLCVSYSRVREGETQRRQGAKMCRGVVALGPMNCPCSGALHVPCLPVRLNSQHLMRIAVKRTEECLRTRPHWISLNPELFEIRTFVDGAV